MMPIFALLLANVAARAVAASTPQLPRLFPRPRLLELSPAAETVTLWPCSFALSRAGDWSSAAAAASRGSNALWPEPPETALEIYRPL